MELDLEENLLASLLKYPECFFEAKELDTQCFDNKYLAEIFGTAKTLHQEGHTVSDVAIFQRNKSINMPALIGLCKDTIPSKINIPHYVGELKRHRHKKIVKRLLIETINNYDGLELNQISNSLSKALNESIMLEPKEADIKKVMDRFEKHQEHNRKNGIGFYSGFDFFDKKQIYYQSNHLIIIGAFTSTGKTSLMIEMLSRLDERAMAVVISTEMDDNQNIARMIARETGWSTKYILSGHIQDHHKSKHTAAKKKIASRNILIYDYHHKLEDIESIIKKASMQGKGNVFFIDYAQNIDSPGTEYEKADRLAKRMQLMAKECSCTIILFSQLSNDNAKNDDILAFKGAGTLAACADVGIILKKNKDDYTKIQMQIRKNRHGPLGNQALQFKNDFTRLVEIDDQYNG